MPRRTERFNYERLIELVREREMLYNPAHESYKDAQMLKNIWNSIGKVLNVTFENIGVISPHPIPAL